MDTSTLCPTDESPHSASFGGRTRHYRCVQDPVVVPFLADDVDTAVVETQSPVSGVPVELRATESGIKATPSDVGVSFGVARDVAAPAEGVSSPILADSRFCPYGSVLRSCEEYETWAADVDAVTMPTAAEEVTSEVRRAHSARAGHARRRGQPFPPDDRFEAV